MRYLIIVGRDITRGHLWTRALAQLKTADLDLYREVVGALHREIVFPESGHHPAKVWGVLQDEIRRRLEAEDAPKADEPPPLVIVVTHSETIVSRLGEEIEYKRILPQDVKIVVIPENGSTEAVKICTFDVEGCLNDPWPWGFFTWQ